MNQACAKTWIPEFTDVAIPLIECQRNKLQLYSLQRSSVFGELQNKAILVA